MFKATWAIPGHMTLKQSTIKSGKTLVDSIF